MKRIATVFYLLMPVLIFSSKSTFLPLCFQRTASFTGLTQQAFFALASGWVSTIRNDVNMGEWEDCGCVFIFQVLHVKPQAGISMLFLPKAITAPIKMLKVVTESQILYHTLLLPNLPTCCG